MAPLTAVGRLELGLDAALPLADVAHVDVARAHRDERDPADLEALLFLRLERRSSSKNVLLAYSLA